MSAGFVLYGRHNNHGALVAGRLALFVSATAKRKPTTTATAALRLFPIGFFE